MRTIRVSGTITVWVPYDAIQQAQVLYNKRSGFDPNRAYDIQIAKVLVRDDE
jgi:hypothetical protein